MTERKWKPGDGAEQTDSSREAAQERLASGYDTAAHHDSEPDIGFDSAYASWRETNGSDLDADYRRWRAETGQNFSQAFLDWASRGS